MNDIALLSTPTIFDSLDITESTRKEYLARLPQFLGWLKYNGITHDCLLDYKKYLRSRTDLGIASKNKYLAVARISLKELHRRGKVPYDLTQNVKSFQQSQKHRVEGLNEAEVQRLCEHLQQLPDSFRAIRLRTLIALLLFQGLRQIEICRLDVSDVDLASGRLYVLGKGRDDKEPIYLHPQTVKAIRAYLNVSKVKDGALFTSLWGQTKGKRLTTRGLRLIVKNLLHEVSVEKTVHGIRHYYVTQLIRAYKGELLTVARYTRHRNLNMLIIYNDQDLIRGDLPNYYHAFTDSLYSNKLATS